MQKLSDSELTLMEKIWECSGPVTAAWLVEQFSDTRGWKSQTVSTFLSRLVEKEMLTCEKHGVQNRYAVAVTQEQYRAQETRSFLEAVHGGSVSSFLASLYPENGLEEEDIRELKSWLARRDPK